MTCDIGVAAWAATAQTSRANDNNANNPNEETCENMTFRNGVPRPRAGSMVIFVITRAFVITGVFVITAILLAGWLAGWVVAGRLKWICCKKVWPTRVASLEFKAPLLGLTVVQGLSNAFMV